MKLKTTKRSKLSSQKLKIVQKFSSSNDPGLKLKQQRVGGHREPVGNHGRVQDQGLGQLLEHDGCGGAGRGPLVQVDNGTHQLGANGRQQGASLEKIEYLKY